MYFNCPTAPDKQPLSIVLTPLDSASTHIPKLNLTRNGKNKNQDMSVLNHVILSQKYHWAQKTNFEKSRILMLLHALHSFQLHA